MYTDPSGKCLGYLWGDPNCQFAGADYTKYDYAGAGQVAVTGLGVAATVVACAGTAGLVCAAGAAGAGAMTSWGNQALNNAGQPVAQAATHVNWGRVAVDAAVGAVSGPICNGAGRLVGPLTGRIASAATRATVEGSIVGGVSSGVSRFLTNVFDSDPNTAATDGLLESCLFGAAVGGLTGRLTYGANAWLGQRARVYANVEIVDSRGSPLGEFDKIRRGLIIEEKSAQGLGILHPVTRAPVQTPEQWAARQIYDKTVVRIRNLGIAATTRSTPGGSATVPSLSEVQAIREIQFHIDADTPELRKAVVDQLARLQSTFLGWRFGARFGP